MTLLLWCLITLLGPTQLVPPIEAIQGSATWYAAPSSKDAAAGPLLRSWLGPKWRGTWVTVTANGRSVTTRLTDWCLCTGGDGRRLIDLDDGAFAQLAPLGRGVLSVTITRADVTLPPTDTAP